MLRKSLIIACYTSESITLNIYVFSNYVMLGVLT